MKQSETLCHKVDQALDVIREGAKKRAFDPYALSHLLHQIRQDAQNMENGLKLRRKVMASVAGLEEEYQGQKAQQEKSKAEVNEIPVSEYYQFTKEEQQYTVTVVDKMGKLLYRGTSFGGVLSIVEEIDGMDQDGALSGQTQKFNWGHPLTAWFAFDQLAIGMEAMHVEVETAWQEVFATQKFRDPMEKARMLKILNGDLS